MVSMSKDAAQREIHPYIHRWCVAPIRIA
jgi:hypothetical protein